ncbi:tetratricopeptide repeat protein [Thalassoroseus pseudoceratinae]|uniref:tetratricopeptide repeat protein n=1 Tax=Thalassoroseus pseudoceratinae TaxID=2713176 RepID=UPI00141DC8EC|nr:tetratricopeptide repeat protein [Thalassoroseus pseudoceratinae]
MLRSRTFMAAMIVIPWALSNVANAQVDPKNANPEHEQIKKQADAAYQQRAFTQAVELVSKVIKENPKDDVAFYLRGSSLVEIGLQNRDVDKLRAGIADARQAISLNGRERIDYYLPYLFGMSSLAGLEDKPEHANVAIQVATQVIGLPNVGTAQSANLYYQRARAHGTLQDWQKAADDFNKALSFNPNHLGARLGAGHAYVRMEDFDKAEEQFDAASKTFPNDPRVYNDRGTFHQQSKQFDKAIADFTKVLELDKNAHYAYMNRGFTYMEKGDPKQAEQDFDRALALQPKQPTLYSLRGTARLMQGRVNDALGDYKMVVEMDTKNPIARGDLAFAEFFAGDYANAAKSFASALDSPAKLEHLRPWLYISLVSSGQKNAADSRFGSGPSGDQAGWDWSDRLLAMLTGKISDEDLLAAVKSDETRVKDAQLCEAHFFLGQKALLAGDRAAAAAHFQKAVATNADNLSAHRGSRFALQRLN